MAKKVDSNQPEIVDTLRRAGYHVLHLYEVGNGCPDLLVAGYHHQLDRIVALLVEVKIETGTLTPAEQLFFQDYPDDGPAIVARSAEEIIEWFRR